MLKVLRDNVKYLSWILWAIIGLFVLFVFADFGGGLRGGKGPVTWAAKVGGATISQSEFSHTFTSMEEQARQAYGEQFSSELEKQLQLPLRALNQAVSNQIMVMEANRIGLKVSDAELRDYILDAAMFHDEQGRFIGEQQYQEMVQRIGYSVATFEETARQDLLRQKLLDALRANLYISDAEIERAYRDQVERAKIRYVELPFTRFADLTVLPSEVAAYFQQHRQDYRLPEERQAVFLLADPNRMLDQVPVGDAEMQAYYKEHQDDWKQDEQVRASHILLMVNDKRTDAQAQQQMEEIKRRIEKGEDFGAVARQVSEDPGSKANGGDLGFFAHGRMVKEFEQAAFAAPEGKLVGPVKSSFGYHLLKVTGHRPGGVQPFAEVREQIRTRLASEKARQLAESKVKELASQLAAHPPKSADEVKALAPGNPANGANSASGGNGGVVAVDTGRFAQQEPVKELGLAPAFNAAVFAAKQGQVTAAIESPRGWVVAYVQGIFPAHLAELSEVEAKVRQEMIKRKQQDTAIQRLGEARRAMQQGKTLDQVAAELGLQVRESAEFGANGSITGLGSSPQVAKLAMTLATGQVGGPVPGSRGAVLFQVTDRKAWDPVKFATAKQQTRQGLLQQQLNTLLTALVERRQRELGVDYNRQLLQQMGVAPEALQQQAG
jgi:peptidyl-prolyl cis-trans isomerase D